MSEILSTDNTSRTPVLKKLSFLLWIEIKRYTYALPTVSMALGFYMLYCLLFQIGLTHPCPMTIATILWIGFILVQLLYAPLWFKEDNQDGYVFDWYVLQIPMHWVLSIKFLLYCGLQGGTFLISVLTVSLYWNVPGPVIKVLIGTLALAIPTVSSLLMTLNVTLLKGRQSFSLLSLLLFPLILPVLIISLMAINSVYQDGDANFTFFIIAELGVMFLTLPGCFICSVYILNETLESL